MAIIGVVSVGALGAFGADVRAADRAQRMLPAAALAEDRLTALENAGPRVLDILPDSLAHGRFAAPFDAYSWTAESKNVRSIPSLIELTVRVVWDGGAFTLAERRYEPMLSSTSR